MFAELVTNLLTVRCTHNKYVKNSYMYNLLMERIFGFIFILLYHDEVNVQIESLKDKVDV